MTTLYLVRHAQAEGNIKHLFQGQSDGPLSKTGERQLEHLAKRFEGVHLDALYSSPLSRAYRSAQAVNTYAKLPIQLDDGLKEINAGKFEGVHFDDLPNLFPVEFGIWNNDPSNFHAPDGESMRQVYDRIRDAIERIVRENQGKTVAVVSHTCAIRCFLCYITKTPFEKLDTVVWCVNTAVNRFTYDDQMVSSIDYIDDAAHLPADLNNLSTKEWLRGAGASIKDSGQEE